MARKTLSAIVAGTGFEGRAQVIRANCRPGAPVQLRREPANPHDADAIAVWMECRSFFGLLRSWKKIGYIKAKRADALAKRIDGGALTVVTAFVRSFDSYADAIHPRVSLRVEVDE